MKRDDSESRYDNFAPAAEKQGVCPVCGVALADHPHCQFCHIGVGPKHVEPKLNDEGLCWKCAELVAEKKARE